MARELGGSFQSQFCFDMFSMSFDSLDAHVQVVGDLASCLSLTDQIEDFQFPVCQLLGVHLS